MKKQQLILLFVSLLFGSILFNSCKGDEPTPEPESAIAENFSFENTTWYFQTVSATGTVLNTDLEDKDDMPDGYVTFNADGTGIFDFEIDLVDMNYGKIDNVTWERASETEVTIVESDGDINEWTMIRANENVVEASWYTPIGDGGATFVAVMTAQE